MRIIIDLDVHNKVVNAFIAEETSTQTDVVINVEKPKVSKKKKEEKVDNSLTVVVGENKLILTPKLVEFLQAKEGDRLSVVYKESNGFVEPFLGKANLFTGVTGNKLTKGLTVSFRGDQRESLLKYGTTFNVEDNFDGSVKLLTEVKVKKKEEVQITELPKEIQDILMSEDEELNLSESNFLL